MKRENISSKYKWSLEDIYKNINEYNKDLNNLEEMVKEFVLYKGKILSSSKVLQEVLELMEKIDIIENKLYVYANMSSHIDTTNCYYQELVGNLNMIISNLSEKISFFMPELLSVDYEKIKSYINENDNLKRFSFYLERLFNSKEHVLSLKEEEIISRTRNILNTPDDVFNILNNADLVFIDILDENNKKQPLTKGLYTKYLTSKHRIIRKRAFINLYNKYKELNNTFASILNSNLLSTNFLYKTRKYKTPLNMYLDDNKIDTKIYYDLIEQVNLNLDKIHKYFNIKKKVLNYNELHMYDLAVSLIEDDKEYDYETAKNIILESLSVLGNDYISNLNKAFNNNWIDVYESKGKRSGAYAWGCYTSHPYILLNYQNKFDDVSTVAHELGHAINKYYSNLKQDFYYSDNEIFVAEIASTVNELLLKLYLLDKLENNKEKASIINELLDDVKNTIYRQTMFAEFELEIHNRCSNNETLTAEKLNTIYYNLVKKYHGDNVNVDEQIKYEWSRIPHFYSPFYVYQYATGLSIAFTIAYKIHNNDKDMLNKYLEFLSSGSNDYSTNLVNKMGINIKESINQALNIFDDLMEEILKLI